MHFIFHQCISIFFITEEKQVALLVYSSFMQITTSGLHRISVFTSSGSQFVQTERNWGLNTDELRIFYSITAPLIGRDGSDVTRLVATAHKQNKQSLLESFSLFNSHDAIGSIN